MSERKLLSPTPEVIGVGEEKWRVIPGRGFVSYNSEDSTRVMSVPLLDNPHSHAVIAHEYCHVKYSPKDYTATETEQALEDFRVNFLGKKAKVNFGEGFSPRVIKSYIEYHAAREDEKRVLLGLLSSDPIEPSRDIAREAAKDAGIYESIHEIYYSVRRELSANPSFSNMQRMAKYVDEYFEERREAKERAALESALASGDMDLEQLLKEAGPGDGEAAKFSHSKFSDFFKRAKNDSGEMRIVTPPLVSRIKGAKQRVIKTSDSGVILSRPERFMTDRRIFRRTTRTEGGTLLIDVSGSMHLSEVEIAHVIDKMPAATVAIYSGNSAIGTLKILVKNGRATSRDDWCGVGTGNVIDLPALIWLSKQSKPRIWISDGAVTGIADAPSDDISAACRLAKIAGGIKRYGSIAAYLKGYPAPDREDGV